MADDDRLRLRANTARSDLGQSVPPILWCRGAWDMSVLIGFCLLLWQWRWSRRAGADEAQKWLTMRVLSSLIRDPTVIAGWLWMQVTFARGRAEHRRGESTYSGRVSKSGRTYLVTPDT
ncbi:hypothetical protein L208DRAFT_1417412 [Tricholoma matsutake]|nr:hypothetical protein L208DRAFT_1417412 [Tricholoma matsutake 945]